MIGWCDSSDGDGVISGDGVIVDDGDGVIVVMVMV